jgi:hypothetical protein
MSHDTPPEVEARYRKLILARAPQPRVAMCLEMSNDSREITRRSLQAAGLTGSAFQRAFLERFYGTDLSSEAFGKCLDRLRK